MRPGRGERPRLQECCCRNHQRRIDPRAQPADARIVFAGRRVVAPATHQLHTGVVRDQQSRGQGRKCAVRLIDQMPGLRNLGLHGVEQHRVEGVRCRHAERGQTLVRRLEGRPQAQHRLPSRRACQGDVVRYGALPRDQHPVAADTEQQRLHIGLARAERRLQLGEARRTVDQPVIAGVCRQQRHVLGGQCVGQPLEFGVGRRLLAGRVLVVGLHRGDAALGGVQLAAGVVHRPHKPRRRRIPCRDPRRKTRNG